MDFILLYLLLDDFVLFSCLMISWERAETCSVHVTRHCKKRMLCVDGVRVVYLIFNWLWYQCRKCFNVGQNRAFMWAAMDVLVPHKLLQSTIISFQESLSCTDWFISTGGRSMCEILTSKHGFLARCVHSGFVLNKKALPLLHFTSFPY
jgi:hypothetical protein